MAKITVGGTTAAPTYTKTETSFTDKVILGVTAPLAIMSSDETEFYSKDDVAVASVVGVAAGVFLGDKFGDSIPVLGQRRGH